MSFALLWGKTLDSSVWRRESKETRLVWITMLMMKDQEGKIQSSVIGLADRARVTKEECLEALKVFLSPDPDDTSKVEEGRRIREIQGGWEIINNDLYRFSTEERRLFWAQAKAAQRAKQAAEKLAREQNRKPLTEAQQARKDAAEKDEFNKRRNPVREGRIQGAQKAMAVGFAERGYPAKPAPDSPPEAQP